MGWCNLLMSYWSLLVVLLQISFDVGVGLLLLKRSGGVRRSEFKQSSPTKGSLLKLASEAELTTPRQNEETPLELQQLESSFRKPDFSVRNLWKHFRNP